MNTPPTFPRGRRFLQAIVVALALLSGGPGITRAAEEVSSAAKTQIQALLAEKEGRTPAQKKMDSQLVYFAKQRRREVIAAAAPKLAPDVKADAEDRVLVDLNATVSAGLLDAITRGGGTIVNQFAAFRAIRALVPIGIVETLAAREDVRSIGPAAMGTTNVGSALSQGDRTHRADTARANTGATGAGIKIGVMSDGVNSLPTSIANGNINASATFLAGQAGSGDEGTAMMEIIQDLVPDAQLIFATANTGDTQFAANIIALKNAGCSIIVDDFTYFNESPFQDAVISQAVNTVSASGVLYFSSARNSGNKNDGTAGTWEGDFVSGGAVAAPVTGSGNLLDFGGGVTYDTVASGGSNRRVDLFWSDPMGAAANDYDLFVLDSTGSSVLRSSTNVQTGTQNPYESTATLNVGERIVIVQRAGAADRFVHLDTGRAVLAISTIGNVRGHNASGAANAFSVAATNVANSPSPGVFTGGATNPVETFSSDGPRRMFYDPSGVAITPGNFSSTGGTVLNKPDITAADGVTTSVSGFTSFFGTSAAAPHAAAIAALLESYNTTLTPAQIRTAMTSTALDIEAAGNDRDSGAGIVMALAAIQSVPAPDVVIAGTPLLAATGPTGGPFNPASATYTLTNPGTAPLNWTASKTQAWTTLSSSGGTLGPGASTTVTCSFNAAANGLGAGNYTDVVTITDTTSGFARIFNVSLKVTGTLTGTKTVGPSGADYTNLTATGGLFDAINSSSVNGTLNVQIIGNLTAETGAVALNALNGTTPAVKIFPSGAARSISGSFSGALIRLNGADNVTLDGSLNGTGTDRSLTITNTSITTPTVISLISSGIGLGATNNAIKNCNISTGVATSIGYGISVGGSTPGTTGADNDNVTIQNNSITAAPIGIYASGTSSASSGGDDNLSIVGNSIAYNSTLASIGIRVGNALNSSVSQNTVSEQTTTIQAPTAISVETGFVSSSVTRNIITKSLTTTTSGYGGRGIAVGTGTATSALTIANNMIYGVNGSNWSNFGNSSAMGIAIGTIGNSSTVTTTAGGINLYYNSVSMTGGMGTGSSSALTAAIYIGSGASGLNIRDNVFANTQVGTSATQKNFAIYSAASSAAFTTIDYNDYFVSNTFNAASAIPGFLTSDRTDLAGVQAGFGQNTHSFIGDPLFTSLTDLHISSAASPTTNAGTSIIGITTDFDGDTRNVPTPDIGADEFGGSAPVVNSPTSVSTTTTSATLGGTVTSDGGLAITERGVVYSITSVNANPLIGGTGVTKLTSAGTTGIFTVNATGLTQNTGYSFKAYAINGAGTTYTTPVSTFTQGVPVVTTPMSTSITTTSATLGGNVTSDGGSAITERGVVYSSTSVNADPLIGGTSVTKLTSAGTTGVFTVNATGLTLSTGYSFKAYAINGVGTTYTAPVSTFTTAGPLVFSNFMDATTVVGQANFTDQFATVSQTVTNGVSSCALSSTGKMATSEQSGRVLIWNTIPTANGAPADVVVGKPNFTSTTTGTTAAIFSNCNGVAFSPDGGKLIASDNNAHRILIWNTVPTSNGVAADVVIGQTDFISGTSGASATKFNNPLGVYVTPGGKLLVADSVNNRVLIYNSIPTSNGAAADVVIGQPDMTTVTSGNAANKLSRPWKAVMAGDGRVLIAEENNNRVVVFNALPSTNGAAADVVIGQSAFGSSASATTATGMSGPLGVAVSASGLVAVSEYANNRVLIYNSIPTTNGAAADFVLGQPTFTSSTVFNGGVSAHSINTAYQPVFASNGRLLVPGTNMHRVMIFGSVFGTPPIVTAPTSTSIASNSATLGGNVTSDGGSAITERGVVYSITTVNADPLIGGAGVTKVTSAGTTGVFTLNATVLTPATGYSFKPYAINSAGTTYATPISTFITLTLQEAWRKLYFNITTNTGDAADTADPDGDSENNLFEYVAGVVPNDATSRFKVRVEVVPGQPAQKAIIFSPLVAGRTYVVKYKNSHDDPAWTTLTNITTSDNGTERTVTDLAATPSPKFYLVEITLP